MELWIRSQDKRKLICNPKLLIQYDCGDYNIVDLETGAKLGTYWEERALEILDEIQKILEPLAKIELPYTGKILSVQELSTYVYEMPKE